MTSNMENRAEVLREMKICRFCLESQGNLNNIYDKEATDNRTVPLPLQIMACVGIEVFANDGMPQLICDNCRTQAVKSYLFKTNCKEADDALKLFIATGTLAKPHLKREFENTPLLEYNHQPFQQQPQKMRRAAPNITKTKRIKIEEQRDIITLNYSNAMEITEVRQDYEDQMSQDATLLMGIDEEQSMEEEDYSESESKINPTLQVKQIQTDCYPCDQCERSFPLKQLLDIHRVNHNRAKGFECEECGKRYYTKHDLLKHMRSHSGTKPYECVVCNKNFSRESLLHRHEKIHVDVPKFLCSHCDRTFLTRHDLDAHVEKHKQERPFLCTICDKGFVYKQSLERHLQTHSKEKPHKCNYCEASFNSTIKLTRHITSHAGLRPYPCKLCGRTFLLSHHLTRHMRSHYAAQTSLDAAINQYKCDICSMSFKKKDSLINHTAIHSMVNLKCVICHTSFENATMVKQHINTHLSGLPFPCEKCDYSFESKDQLEEHMVKHAEMEYEDQIEKEVVEEAKQQQQLQGQIQHQEMMGHNEELEDEEECAEEEEDDIVEFTITNDINNPEVVRRSTRVVKPKAYPDFLKDELISEEEEEEEDGEEGGEETQEAEFTIQNTKESEANQEEYTIKPIVRSEGTKVYTRKSLPNPASYKFRPPLVTPSSSVAKDQEPVTIDNITLSNHDIEALPTKKYVDMKVGDKMLRVQKLIVSKEEMLALAREGKIEVSGKTILYRKAAGPSTVLNKEFPLPMNTSQPKEVKKVYERKSNTTEHSDVKSKTTIDQNINLQAIPLEDVSITRS